MRISEYVDKFWTRAGAMYGVIIVMTFTGTLRNSRLNTPDVYSTVVLCALFCCIAWGIADGFYTPGKMRTTQQTDV